MIDINKIYVWIIITALILIIPGIHYITYLDELCAMAFFGVAVLDAAVNHAWRKYRLLWLITAIIGAYTIYSIVLLSNNTPPYIMMDWIIEIKPFVPFAVLLCAGIRFTRIEKTIIEKICIINCTIISLLMMASIAYFGKYIIDITVQHISYCGHIIFLCMMLYLFCKIDRNGSIDRSALFTTITFLTLGLLCTRSKYYAVYICAIPFLLYYRPGITRHLTIKHLIAIGLIGILVITVTWTKFNFYFMGGADFSNINPAEIEAFARPVLYATSFMIFVDYFPFGSGLASFASFPSAASYSNIYYEYGINNVWGLSPSMPDFICDAYYPSLAQFGIIGVILFIWFWIYAYSFIRIQIRNFLPQYKYNIIIGSLCIIFILVESTTGTTFTFTTGLLVMALLGIASYPGYEMKLSADTHRNDKSLCIPLTDYKIQ
ncbi:MAG: hypothetical protein K2M94_06415 [Paramuribaculum sp.]|nr:hypothetical protein [Paramuribaculum sp.]